MQVTFLGTSCMVPTKERNAPSVLLSYNNIGILFDCGEGTQRQMNIAGIKRNMVKIILISHWHGDHISGLIGLLQTIGNDESVEKIRLFGPKGTRRHVANLLGSFAPPDRLRLEVKEIAPKGIERFYESEDFFLECGELEHGMSCIGFSFVEKDKIKVDMKKARMLGLKQGPLIGRLQREKGIILGGKRIRIEDVSFVVKGKKITYIADTVLCKNAIELAKDADLLICEAAYTSKLENKAEEYRHLTAKQAAQIANQADVKKLYLTHFSQRYKNTQEIEEDARTVFDNVVCAKDFMKVNL